MRTDEADSLVGRIARVLDEVRDDLCGFDAEEMSSAVLPIVAVEVRKAKVEAWDEGLEAGYRNAEATRPYDEMWTDEEPTLIDNPYRETGDKHE